MYRLDDINENVTSYGYWLPYTVRYKQLQFNLFLYPNGLTNLKEIWNQDFLGDDASFEETSPFWEIEPGTFNISLF